MWPLIWAGVTVVSLAAAAVVAALVIQARGEDLHDLPLIEHDETYWDDDPALWD